MGWLWTETDKSKDPLRDLDPSLREFLKKESPLKYDSSTPAAKPDKPVPEVAQTSPTKSLPGPEEAPASKYPTQFKDGRYNDIWKTYQPLNDVESTNKSDQEKIADVIDAYKFRRTEINRAALENCAMEQWEVQQCFESGSLTARATLCRAENRRFNRCYEMQAKFLKALGYLSSMDRDADVNEQIQMHADTLFQRMLKQEKAIEDAKKEGREAPKFPPLLSDRFKFIPQKPEAEGIQVADLSPAIQAGFKKRLDGLSGEERLVEEKAIRAEIQVGEELAKNLGMLYDKQERDRNLRKTEGRETFGDRVTSAFGFRSSQPDSNQKDGESRNDSK